jgi:SAM-dependent methyltransferase
MLDFDGAAFLSQECEPYAQYWLSESERRLHGLFTGPAGLTPRDALAAYFRQLGETPTLDAIDRLTADLAGMRECGVLIEPDEDTSRYTADIVEAYLRHRPFPPELTRHIVGRAGVGAGSRVLDLAGGPGDLALQIAATGAQVSLMELSRGFLQAAEARAAQAQLALTTVHDSCNRLLHHPQVYDVVTIAQALHWMDDVQLTRGLCRVLAAGGHFLVVHAAMSLPGSHPLSYLLGDDSILGAKASQPFADEVAALARRLGLLFEAFETVPGVSRQIETRVADISLFRQPRPIDVGFAKAFLTDRHIDATGLSPAAFWADVDARLASATSEDLVGAMDWGVIHFQRGTPTASPVLVSARDPIEIGFGPAQAAPAATGIVRELVHAG